MVISINKEYYKKPSEKTVIQAISFYFKAVSFPNIVKSLQSF